MIGTFANILRVPELKKRIGYTLMVLFVYRLGCFIPVPGINTRALSEFIESASQGAFGSMIQMVNIFSGGALQQATIFALGIMPYISASIVFQLLTAVVPALEKLAKEGEIGRRKINQYTRYATVVLCLLQGFMIVKGLEGLRDVNIIPEAQQVLSYELFLVLMITAGTVFLMWLGESIDQRGIGNGISILIMISIVSRMPTAAYQMLSPANFSWKLAGEAGKMGPDRLLIMIALYTAIVVAIIYITQGQRRIPVQAARQIRGNRMTQMQRSYLPLRVNQAGVMPIIFAQSLLYFPIMIFQWIQPQGDSVWARMSIFIQKQFADGAFTYMLVYTILIFFFCYFYTAITFNPADMADNMKQYGSFIPGIRPGRKTSEYLERVMTRITLAGASFLAIIALLPKFIQGWLGVDQMVAGFFGGTGLLIVVGVALDVVQQLESRLMMHNYDGFMKSGRIRGRRS